MKDLSCTHPYNLRGRPSELRTEHDDDDDNMQKIKRVKLKDERVKGNDVQNIIGITTIIAVITPDNTKLVQFPLELLAMILSLLKPADLLQYRQINSTWKSTINNLLIHQQSLQICINFGDNNDAIPCNLRNNIKINSGQNLRLFNNCLRKLNHLNEFPCVRFRFDGVDLSNKIVQMFFNIFGTHIKSLSLYQCNSPVTVHGHLETLCRLLVKQAPNVDHLCIQQHLQKVKCFSDSIPKLFPDHHHHSNKTKLPALTTLDADEVKNIMEEIMGAATNLKTYNPLTFGDHIPLELLVNNNKLDTIKEIGIRLSEETIDFCEKFALHHLPKLQIMTLNVDQLYLMKQDKSLLSRAAVSITKILDSSSQTLEIIGLQPIGFIPGIRIPVLHRLKSIKMYNAFPCYLYYIPENIFPMGLNFDVTFPKIKNVTIDLWSCSTNDFWNTYYPSQPENCFSTVRSVEIHGMPRDFVQKTCDLFPNMKKLVVTDMSQNSKFQHLCRQLWQSMKRLEWLELNNINFHQLGDRPGTILDSSFTGLYLETCSRLATAAAAAKQSGIGKEELVFGYEVDDLRENLSILELKDLKIFNIGIYDSRRNNESWTGPILSSISGHVFKMMPQLKVTVIAHGFYCMDQATKLRIKTALDAIAPYVHSTKLV